MPRYIDADDLAKVFMLKGKDKLRLATVINEIEMSPTADVVEVVRCKDCRYCYQKKADRIVCAFSNYTVAPLDFCSCGERRSPSDASEENFNKK